MGILEIQYFFRQKKKEIFFWNLIPKIQRSIVKKEGRVKNKELPGKGDKQNRNKRFQKTEVKN